MLRSIAATALLTCLLAGQSARAQLPDAVGVLLRSAQIPDDALGAIVIRGNTTVLAHNAQRSMLPASTMKVLTSAVALEQLGPIFRGRTELRSSADVINGVLKGDLILRGLADADFNEDALVHLLQNLRNQGIRKIQGDLVLDRQLFQPARPDLGAAPFDTTPEFRYNVIPDALLLNTNLVTIDIKSVDGKLTLTMLPELDNVTVTSDMTPVKANCAKWEDGWRAPQALRGPNGKLQVVLHGSFPANCSHTTSINVLDRQDYADRLFRAIWKRLGGSISGGVREASPTGIAPVINPVGTRLLADHVARALPEVLRDMNKNSDNTLARTIFLSLGSLESDAWFGSHPVALAAPEDTALRARQVVQQWLQRHAINSDGLVIDNGSGLSRSERIAPSQLAAVLQAVLASAWAPEFLSSLPIAGLDGTMRRRLAGSPAVARARIKTGTLNGVTAIAGVVQDANNQPCIVVAFVNHELAGSGGGRAALDALIGWVAASGAPVPSPAPALQ